MVSVAKHLESHDAALWWSWASELGHFYVIFPHSPCYLTDLVCLSGPPAASVLVVIVSISVIL